MEKEASAWPLPGGAPGCGKESRWAGSGGLEVGLTLAWASSPYRNPRCEEKASWEAPPERLKVHGPVESQLLVVGKSVQQEG